MRNLTDIGGIKSLLKDHGFALSKGLGQNFIVEPSICPRMAEESGIDESFGVLEIGPGIGVLTKELCLRAKKVVAVELDSRLIPVLRKTLADFQNLKVIEGDVLKLDLHRLIAEEFGGMRVCVCANLPYYITSPIIMKILESRLPVEFMTVMVQKEAAARLCAPIPSRAAGAVTIAVSYYAEPALLFPVSKGAFFPAPKVDSAVIKLDVRKTPSISPKDEQKLFETVKAAFGQRRKTVLNSIGHAFGRENAREALESAGVSLLARAENLTLQNFCDISDNLLLTRE